jgi:hypothetical protein
MILEVWTTGSTGHLGIVWVSTHFIINRQVLGKLILCLLYLNHRTIVYNHLHFKTAQYAPSAPLQDLSVPEHPFEPALPAGNVPERKYR